MLSRASKLSRAAPIDLEVSVAYVKMQINAGGQVMQIFDSWAGALAHEQFREFSLHYLTTIYS